MATTTVQQQPDISYHPDYDKYQIRIERLRKERASHTALPSSYPEKVNGPLVWEGKDFTDEAEWTFVLTPDQLSEIHSALNYFNSLKKELGHISPATFPLPELSTQLRSLSATLHNGRGFFVLRGLKPESYSVRDNIAIYAGMASHIAPIRGRQDTKLVPSSTSKTTIRQSSMLNHIKDLSTTSVAGNIGAPAYTTDKQVFHTDAGDIVSLFCLSTAAKGGESYLASAWQVYNELAAARPDLIKTLSEDWIFNGGAKRPLLYHTPATPDSQERIIIQYARRGFTGYLNLPRDSSLPPITEAQAEALDALHFLAEKNRLTLDFRVGDVQFVNNLSVFHARDGFIDDPAVGKERHLLRLWLRDPEFAWQTPEPLGSRWDELYQDVTEDEQVFPLEPRIRGGAGKA